MKEAAFNHSIQTTYSIRNFFATENLKFSSHGRSSHYDATIGRWTTKDPIGFAGGDTNLYDLIQTFLVRTDGPKTGS